MVVHSNGWELAVQDPTRPIRGLSSAAFSPDGTRLYTLGRYVDAWRMPSLEPIFRVRPLPHLLSGLALQPGGDRLMSAHRTGQFALLDGDTGEILGVCGPGTYMQDVKFGLSPCGGYCLHAMHGCDEWVVRDIRTNDVVWRRSQRIWRLTPANDGAVWLVDTDTSIDAWSWPFGDAPRWSIPLGRTAHVDAVAWGRFAVGHYRRIDVHDLDGGGPLHSLKCGTLGTPYFMADGNLLVVDRAIATSGTAPLESDASVGGDGTSFTAYDAMGRMLGAAPVPGASYLRHACAPDIDRIAIVDLDGVRVVDGIQARLRAGEGIARPWPERAAGAPELSSGYRFAPPDPPEGTRLAVDDPDALRAAIGALRRNAWRPLVEARAGAPADSKFGGTPVLAPGETWPRCARCDGWMDLFLQLNGATLPADAPLKLTGLLQVFVCTDESADGACSVGLAFSSASLVRLLPEPWSPAPPPDVELFAEMAIVGWQREEDHPHLEDLSIAGVSLDDALEAMQGDSEFPAPLTGDKLLGWPDWQQGREPIACPECSNAMDVIFQIGSDGGIPLMLGDGGTGWVSQCPHHPHVVSFHYSGG